MSHRIWPRMKIFSLRIGSFFFKIPRKVLKNPDFRTPPENVKNGNMHQFEDNDWLFMVSSSTVGHQRLFENDTRKLVNEHIIFKSSQNCREDGEWGSKTVCWDNDYYQFLTSPYHTLQRNLFFLWNMKNGSTSDWCIT